MVGVRQAEVDAPQTDRERDQEDDADEPVALEGDGRFIYNILRRKRNCAARHG
jgi:hypothetical protein